MQSLANHASALCKGNCGQDSPNKVLASSTVTVNPLLVTVIVARYATISARTNGEEHVHSRSQS